MLFLTLGLYALNLLGGPANVAASPATAPTTWSPLQPRPQPNPYPRLPSKTIIVPNTKVRIRVTAKSFGARMMFPSSVETLISTGLIALDLLASWAGGPESDLDRPRLGWQNAGLEIFMNDATVRDPLSAGGPFRFDEMRAVYVGVREAVGDISWVECEVLAFRTSSVMRRNVKFLGWGYVASADMVGAVEERKGNGTWVSTA